MRRRCWKSRGILTLAIAPVVSIAVLGETARAACIAGEPALNLASLRDVTASSVARPRITALPLQSPSVNGFQPFVVFGLTNENDNDFFSPQSDLPGGVSVPNPASYFIGTLDSGSSAHIMSYADSNNLLFPAGLEGNNTVDLAGSGGSVPARVSDALGFYVSGLGNATAGVSGPIVPTNTFRGTTNTPILTLDDPPAPGVPAFPNVIGAPAFAYHQVAILNGQTQRLTVNGQTYQGPHVEMRTKNTPLAPGFVKVAMEPLMPGGAIGPVVFEFDPFQSNWSEDPYGPAVWNGLYADVDLSHTGGPSLDNQFLFDTGAQVSVLSKLVANSIGISTNPGNETPEDFTVEVLGVGGVTTVRGYIIESLGLLTDLGSNMTWTNVPIIVADLPDPRDGSGFVPGILGMNLFNDRDLIVNADIGFEEGTWLGISQNPYEARWTANAGGNWGDNSKWMLGVPSVAEAPANFTSSTAAPQTINVEADYTLGKIKFDNAGAYTVSGTGRLTLETVVGPSTIDVVSGSHVIAAPMTVASANPSVTPSVVITVTPPASTLTISNDVDAGIANLTKAGAGSLAMKNVRAASLAVNAGKLTVLSNGSTSGVSNV
ncbi:MAG: retropepsin-like aspartic protease [Tepidisphaeraceae bacterium]